MNHYYIFTDVDTEKEYPLLSGRYLTIDELDKVYSFQVDKTEYKDIDDWLFDMKRCGIITTI